MQLAYVIEFVGDMERAVEFYRDKLGLALKFQTAKWSEFVTGETTFALHPASAENPAGTVRTGFNVPDIHLFYAEATARGVEFHTPPTAQEFGTMASVRDSEGALVTVARGGK
jgi:catechol 2,3-dioxygenase-like lactoylglutathione lyase family enzyme